MAFVDMHIHTVFSDGTYTPEDVVRHAVADGAGLIALRMLCAYARLNGPGRERCVEMMEDLSEIARFEG